MKRVLVWDAPNIDNRLSEFLGGGPPSIRPEMKNLMRWLKQRSNGDEVTACVFVNVGEANLANDKFEGWLNYLRSQGFYVFAKPKTAAGQGDIDDDMVAFIRERLENCREIIIASHDAKCFNELATQLIQRGIAVVVLGFREHIGRFESDQVKVVDLELIPNLFKESLPRGLRLASLPPNGKLFEPANYPVRSPEEAEVMAMNVRELLQGRPPITERACNCLEREKIFHVEDLIKKTENDLLAITNFGDQCLDLVKERLDERSLRLREEDD